MRSVYWLTAITLVAAAVLTVAVADYGRRHHGSLAFWNKSEPALPATAMTKPADSTAHQPPALMPSSEPVMLTRPASEAASIPAVLPPMTVQEIPEHRELRNQTLSGLSLMQLPEKAGASSSVPAPSSSVVADEFTFPEKAVPAPPVPVPAPLPSHSDFATTPPGSAVGVPSPLQIPEYRPEGREVFPGLQPVAKAKSADDDLANPVQDCLLAGGELITLSTLPVHLMTMPIKARTASTVDASLVCVNAETSNPDKKSTACVASALSCCNDKKSCCDDVVVRTYSVAEFASEKGNLHEELTQLITNMVAPETWATKDSNIVYFPQGKCLVVRHRAAVQDQVDDLLSQLRTAVQKQNGMKLTYNRAIPYPVVSHEPTSWVPAGCEMVPQLPIEVSMTMPRVITHEPKHCFDDEFFGLIPVRQDGRLLPIPSLAPSFFGNQLVPAQFAPKVDQSATGCFDDGPVNKAHDARIPGFFPMFLPYVPMPMHVEVQGAAAEKPAKDQVKE